MGDTAISWTHRPGTRGRTWNPVRGCSRTIAAGAKQSGCGDGTGGGCYAERTAARFCGPGKPYEGLVRLTATGPRWTGEVRLVPEHLADPLRWREPSTVFTNSMSDLFHEALDNHAIDSVVAVMMICALRQDGPRHTFQTLTKRAARMRAYFADPATQERVARRAGAMMEDGDGWFDLIAFRKEGLVHPSMWWGVSTEHQAAANERIPELLQTPAAVRFISAEPLLGPIDLHAHDDGLHHWLPDFGKRYTRGDEPVCQAHGVARCRQGCAFIDQVIVGAESGPGARLADIQWFRSLKKQCERSRIAFFVKQIVVDGKLRKELHEFPTDLQIQEFPR
jgi:protein gp37